MARSPKSDRAYRHNALSGSNAMMMGHLQNVLSSDTTTHQAKQLAQMMFSMGGQLGLELKNRKD